MDNSDHKNNISNQRNSSTKEISGYKLIAKIGEGGMATVYKGFQVSLNRPVAIKILSRKLADNPNIRERFQRESLVIARLNNPHIIHVIDRGITPKGMPYFVMEYVQGTDLAVSIQTGTLDFNQKLELIIQLCKALSYAHKNGVIHRDIKPSNVLIDREGNARMLDFGIAQFYSDEDEDTRHTQPGMLMGTLPYMSPEQQVSADKVTILSDLYSLGVLMYEMFTGFKPLGRFKLPSEIVPTLPKPLEEVIMSCLNPEPINRPATADDIKDLLLKLLRGAHLETAQKDRASQGITKVKERFALLDVIKEERYSAVYLYEEKINQKLLVIKKKPSTNVGFMEAKLLTSLKHKNIVNVLGASRNEQFFIIVMEYLSGGSLNDRLIKPYPLDEFLKTAREICQGLSFAHRNRIVHGNLRPSNILFSETGQVKIADFGLDEHYANRDDLVSWYNVKGEPKSRLTDIFATGVIFYQMLTGAMPPCVNPQSSQDKNFESLPLELQQMLSQMLSLERENRLNSFDQIITQIDQFQDACLEKTALGTEIHMHATESLKRATALDSSHGKTRGLRIRRFFWTFCYLMIFLGLVTAYLAYSGNLQTFTQAILSAWDMLLEQLEPFFQERLIPAWEQLKKFFKK